MTPEQQQRFDDNADWAMKFVYVHPRMFYFEALQNAALIGLWHAVMKWSGDRGEEHFRPWASIYIKGQIKNEHARSLNRLRPSRVVYDDLDRPCLMARNAEEVVFDLDTRDLITHLLEFYTPEERWLLTEIFINEKPLSTIDKEQGRYIGWAQWQFTKLLRGDVESRNTKSGA